MADLTDYEKRWLRNPPSGGCNYYGSYEGRVIIKKAAAVLERLSTALAAAERERDELRNDLDGARFNNDCLRRAGQAAEAREKAMREVVEMYANPRHWSVDGTFLVPNEGNTRSAGGEPARAALRNAMERSR